MNIYILIKYINPLLFHNKKKQFLKEIKIKNITYLIL